MSEDVPYILRLFLTFFKMFTFGRCQYSRQDALGELDICPVAFLKLLNKILRAQLNSTSSDDTLNSSRFLLNKSTVVT